MEINLVECKPAASLEEQLNVIEGELYEAKQAVKTYRQDPTKKNRAEILFELIDVINATQTAILMEFNEEEVEAGIQYTNAKTFVRGYQLYSLPGDGGKVNE